jgi:hypothetical protein
VSHHFDSPTAVADGLAWAGLAADPFTADGIALAGFLGGLAAGQYDPGVFTSSPGNIFAGRDVTAIALQVPDADLGGTRIGVWARISLLDIAVAVLAGSTLGNASVPRPPTSEFPYLSAPSPAELPALADLFGLREHRPE